MVGSACGPGGGNGSDSGPAITHGPVLGRLGSTHVGVWARTSQPGEFSVFYGTEPDALTSAATGSTALEDDNTGWVLIEDLQPGTKYHYQVASCCEPTGDPERSGSFHTLPDAAAMQSEHNPEGRFNFRFEFACGNNQNSSGSPDRHRVAGPRNDAALAGPRLGGELDRLRDPRRRLALRERHARLHRGRVARPDGHRAGRHAADRLVHALHRGGVGELQELLRQRR